MQLVLIIVGGIAGLFLASGSDALLGMGAGAAAGYLFAQLRSLQKRLRHMELEFNRAKESSPRPPAIGAATRPAKPVVKVQAAAVPTSPQHVRSSVAPPLAVKSAAAGAAPTPPPLQPIIQTPGPLNKILDMAKGWLTTGNVPVKLGVIVSFFGVAFLLRYAVDQGLIVVSIEARYFGVTALAGVLLAIGWRLRERLPVYALSLQGGGIGVLYLAIFAAFRLHQLVPATFAFALLVVLTAAAGVLAVLQNAMALAVFGTVGGFLAPVLVSTGSGNYVGLFSYYLLLNAAVLGIAWYRPWRILNVLGFAFTFGVATAWGYENYRPEFFASTEPFLVAFFVFYQAIAILFALRQPPKLRGIVDGTLVFGTPVVAFALQSKLVGDTEYGLAISAVVLAVFYSLVATWLHRQQNKQLRMLIESFIALSVAFATIAIPLALDDRWTAAAWSMEGAALIWISVGQRRTLARLAGTVLLGAAGLAYLKFGWAHDSALPILNGNLLGGLLISISSLFSARYLAADRNPIRGQQFLSAPLLVWGLCWWGGVGIAEIVDWADDEYWLHILNAFFAISAGVLARLGRRYDWTAARRATLAFLPVLPVVVILYLLQHEHVFAGFGTLSWLLVAVAHFALLRAYDNGQGRIEAIWHFAGALFLVGIADFEIAWRIDEYGLADAWVASGGLLIPALAAIAIMSLRENLAWPLQRYWTAYLAAATTMIVGLIIGIAAAGLDDPGNPQPLPYVPLLNPFDLLTVVGLVVGLRLVTTIRATSDWLGAEGLRIATAVWALTAFALSTIAVVRGVHHLGGVGWQQHTLTSSVSVQSALSIYWAILGFGGMIWGARRMHRTIWIIGTALMALVVVKLFVVDLGNTGTVARIVSFLGVGALLLVVGYFAPAPPRQEKATEA